MKVLVTGNAGFIGFHVVNRLLERGDEVVGFDCVDDYYDPGLKEARLLETEKTARTLAANYRFVRANLLDRTILERTFDGGGFDRVIHLAAQAGVRYSLENPYVYVDSNVTGFLNILENCRRCDVPHLTYASSSSVYGANTLLPYSEHDGTAHPLAIYSATKRANELMAHSYSHLYRLPTTGLRLFTVYGPWGRPDMAFFLFTRRILEGKAIQVFNNGHHARDFTYVDDVAEGVIRASDQIASPNDAWDSDHPDPATSNAPYRLFNVGSSSSVSLNDYIEAIEEAVGLTASREMLPLQKGDVPNTAADVTDLSKAVGYCPETPVKDGVARFVDWYRSFYKV